MTTKEVLNDLDTANIEYHALGDQDEEIRGFSSIYNYREHTISWLRNRDVLNWTTVVPEKYACLVTSFDCPYIENCACQIKVKDPKDTFFFIVEAYWGEKTKPNISSLAFIETGAIIGDHTSIGPFSDISKNTVIGDNCSIGSNVTIKGRVHIGNDCVIQSGAVIGEDGFAFIKENNVQRFVKHYGGVTIEDHASIGAQTCVCRGAIDDTYIKEYAKIDNLCHIAHNVVVGKRTIVVARSVIMGSVRIGDDCWIATSIIRDQRSVGNNCVVGMGAVVVKDVPDNTTVAGVPAKPFERKEQI